MSAFWDRTLVIERLSVAFREVDGVQFRMGGDLAGGGRSADHGQRSWVEFGGKLPCSSRDA